jgi:hypothetical protein
MRVAATVGLVLICVGVRALAQSGASSTADSVDAETLQHFQALVRMDTSDPPGNEKPAADYLVQVLEREGIPVQVFAREAHRPNVVARLAGTGAKRPLLIMGHTDVVNVDPAKWQHPPFAAVRDLEDGPKGFGAHGDQERIIEAELYRFVRFHYDTVVAIAGSAR